MVLTIVLMIAFNRLHPPAVGTFLDFLLPIQQRKRCRAVHSGLGDDRLSHSAGAAHGALSLPSPPVSRGNWKKGSSPNPLQFLTIPVPSSRLKFLLRTSWHTSSIQFSVLEKIEPEPMERDMNERYDLEKILMNTHNRFLMQPGYEDTSPYQYQIYFQIGSHGDRFYVVRAEQNARAKLWKITGHSFEEDFLEGELIENPNILSLERANLGKVMIKFDGRIIKVYANYDDFWEDVGHR